MGGFLVFCMRCFLYHCAHAFVSRTSLSEREKVACVACARARARGTAGTGRKEEETGLEGQEEGEGFEKGRRKKNKAGI